MEDRNVIIYPFGNDENLLFVGVFDGHAGFEVAEKVSEYLPSIVLEKIQNEKEDFSKVFHDSFLECDLLIKDYKYEGTTCTIGLIWRNALTKEIFVQFANVGGWGRWLHHSQCRQMLDV